MAKLVFGKEGQVRFKSEEELNEAVDYILHSPNADYSIIEHNELQGARAPEHRIHFKHKEGIPECLLRNMTAGKDGLFGRINCKEFVEYLNEAAEAEKK